MKLSINHSRQRQAGISLIECLVYIAVFAILMNAAGVAFYFCWDHTRAVIYATDDIESALRAGECWRADVRRATGKISVAGAATNEMVTIPAGVNQICYRLMGGELWRETTAKNDSRRMLGNVKASRMKPEERPGIHAWCWDLELKPRRQETHLPLQFTFEAVIKNTP